MDSYSSESISKPSGIKSYNYSIDAVKKAIFQDEINSVLKAKKTVAFNPIIDYLEMRIKEINDLYK